MSMAERAPQASSSENRTTISRDPAPPEEVRPLAAKPASSVNDLLTRRLYFRGLGLVCLIAFLSLWSQIHGLIGEQGLLPAGSYFKLVHERFGADSYWKLPSLCWIASGDLMLHIWCGLGTALSIILLSGVAPRLSLLLLWMTYLSLTAAGQVFLSFQWDTLLLEMLVCSLLYAPRGLRPNWQSLPEPLPIARWLLWSLAFKLMFLSGVTKLLSGDAAWNDGTALQFHYYTQPIPNWISWYAYHMPFTMHQIALLGMFVVEVLMPFLIFVGRRGRAVFGVASILLMIAIEATGNFGFFNLQTVVLCLPLLNDDLLRRFIRYRPSETKVNRVGEPRARWRSMIGSTAAILVLCASGLATVREMVRTQQADKLPSAVVTMLNVADRALLSWGEPCVLTPLSSLRTINGYGLFRVMTTRRTEIVVEISDDGNQWEPCEFPYKPGWVDRAPPIVAPHMPRLDWQMWFAALNPRGSDYWLSSLTQRILEGNPTVARLFGKPSLARDPPRFVRLTLYEYKFSSPEQRRTTGAWWSRSHLGDLTGAIARPSG